MIALRPAFCRVLLPCLLLVACRGPEPRTEIRAEAPPPTISLVGELLRLPSLTPPEQGDIELRVNVQQPDGRAGDLLLQQVLPIREGRLPPRFELALPAAYADSTVVLQGTVRDSDGRPRGYSRPLPARLSAAFNTAGRLRFGGEQPLAEATDAGVDRSYLCGDEDVRFSLAGGQPVLLTAHAGYRLEAVESASGARYRGRSGEFEVDFWSHGDHALLTVNGERRPECRRLLD